MTSKNSVKTETYSKSDKICVSLSLNVKTNGAYEVWCMCVCVCVWLFFFFFFFFGGGGGLLLGK